MKSSWREHARAVIAGVLEENKGRDEKQVAKALRNAYPFGERKYHPYKVWLDEVQIQMGKRRFGVRKEKADKNQMGLF